MVRMVDLHDAGRKGLEALECPVFSDRPWVDPKPLSERTVALISTAGLIRRGDEPFKGGDAGYRAFDDDVANDDIVLSHISVNFDRTMAFQDLEGIFPRARLRELVESGVLGATSTTHYSFMGATDPAAMEDDAKELATRLQAHGVDTAVFLPV